MRIIFAIIMALSTLNAGINPIKDLKKEKKENLKISKKYSAYVSKKDPKSFIIVNKEEEFDKYIKGEEFKYKEVNIYEDNGTYMFPTGKFKVKNYQKPNEYYKKEVMAQILGFDECDTYNRITYECYSASNEFYKKIILNKLNIEKMRNISIETEYLYLFK